MEDLGGQMQTVQSALKRCLKAKAWLKIPRIFIKNDDTYEWRN